MYLVIISTILSLIIPCFCQVNITVDNGLLDENQVVDVLEGESFEFVCSTDRNVIIDLTTNPTAVEDTFDGSGSKVRTFSRSYIHRDISSTIFTCADGQQSSSFTLNVLHQPEYEFSMSSYTAKEREPFMVSAMLDSNPAVTDSNTIWIKNGMVITESYRVQLNSTTIIITSVNRDDTGEYVVEGTNTAGSGNATFDLEVFFGPDFTSNGSNIQVNEGKPLRINCSVGDSNPEVQSVNISGYGINMMTLPDDNRVHQVIDAVTIAYNNTTFTCTASNGETMSMLAFTVTVIQGPTESPTMGPTEGPTDMTDSSTGTTGSTTDDGTVDSQGSTLPGGAIAGIIIGVLVGVALLVVVVIVIAFVIVKIYRRGPSGVKSSMVKPTDKHNEPDTNSTKL